MNRLDTVIAQVFSEEDECFDEETPFAEGATWDSLKHVQLVVALQTQFGVDLTSEEIARITSKRAARAVLGERGIVV
jgi:acyl carrier protein